MSHHARRFKTLGEIVDFVENFSERTLVRKIPIQPKYQEEMVDMIYLLQLKDWSLRKIGKKYGMSGQAVQSRFCRMRVASSVKMKRVIYDEILRFCKEQQALMQLKQDVFTDWYVNDLSFKEIASKRDISVNTIRSMVNTEKPNAAARARRRLGDNY